MSYGLSVFRYASASFCLATKALRHEGFNFRLYGMGFMLWVLFVETEKICIDRLLESLRGTKQSYLVMNYTRFGLAFWLVNSYHPTRCCGHPSKGGELDNGIR
ncbi:hypothetical protein [Flavobacterium weaverense]|uniref:hypothetical protein n=1 Tax=Flavobacterium weaverense TaxID=271156 RepID=UPI000EF9A035|nr:hypothetical protein [Flavobacterium weaverense]